jgi:hypothetical protein
MRAAESAKDEGAGLQEHAGDDERFASDAIGPVPGPDLAGAPDGRVEGGDEADRSDAGAVGGEEQWDEPPGERVVEVVDQAGLRARSQRGRAPGRVGERPAQRRGRLIRGPVVARLLQGDVRGGVADKEDAGRQSEDGDGGAGGDEHVAGGEVGREPAAERGRGGHAAVAGGLVEAEGQAAARGSDEVDLHDPRPPLLPSRGRESAPEAVPRTAASACPQQSVA